MLKCLATWDIDHKLSAMTCDNSLTTDSLVEKLNKLHKPTLLLDGQLFHMICYAHFLHLLVKDGLAMIIDSGIERVRDGVDFWTSTTK